MKTNRMHDRTRTLLRDNLKLLRRLSTELPRGIAVDQLRHMTKTFGFSLALGDCLYLNGGWYVTHSGLLRLAQRRRCAGIGVQQVRALCDPAAGRWVFKATLL